MKLAGKTDFLLCPFYFLLVPTTIMLKKSYSKTKPVCKVTFTLPVEGVQGGKEVRILGDFNNWSWENGTKMKAGKKEFSAAVELEAGKNYEFRYLIDNHIWENDWAADGYVAAPFGTTNSVVAVEAVAAKKAPAKKAAAKKTTVAKNAKASSDAAAPTTKAAPAKKTAAKKAAADSLTKIEGIGPKIAGLLNDAGIVTFADLAKANVKILKGILEAAGKRYQMHDPSTWAKQAKLAANGDLEKLAKLQEELKGGKVAK